MAVEAIAVIGDRPDAEEHGVVRQMIGFDRSVPRRGRSLSRRSGGGRRCPGSSRHRLASQPCWAQAGVAQCQASSCPTFQQIPGFGATHEQVASESRPAQMSVP